MFADRCVPGRCGCLELRARRLIGLAWRGLSAFADLIQVCSDAAVAKNVPGFRDAIAAFGGADSQCEQLELISECLAWDALIHTSYFHSATFTKLLKTPRRPGLLPRSGRGV